MFKSFVDVKLLYKRKPPVYARPMGLVSTAQMYCSLLFGGYLLATADAPLLETSATAGALASLSSSIFLATKMHNQKVITGVCTMKSKTSAEKLVGFETAGMTGETAMIVRERDIRRMVSKDPNLMRFSLGKSNYSIDLSKEQLEFSKARDLRKILCK